MEAGCYACMRQLHVGPGHRVVLNAAAIHDIFSVSPIGKYLVPLVIYSCAYFYLICSFRFEYQIHVPLSSVVPG